ncbi:hypothetical protein LQZ19_08065 [Treponema primitia]|uniref:cyclophilin-like fold protein n=1 Tax=Treponema primitia TaxID=88058 RepID=UPI003980E9A0
MGSKIGIFAFLVLTLTLSSYRVFAQDRGTLTDKRLKITIGNTVLTAVLIDNETTRDFLTLLPMTVKASDYVSREKYWHLPRALALTSDRQSEYERGDLGFWIPNNDMALFYNHDGSALPNPGLIVIAKITSGLNVFNQYPGSANFKIELAE